MRFASFFLVNETEGQSCDFHVGLGGMVYEDGTEFLWGRRLCIQCMFEDACSFMTALGYSKAVVSSSQLSCQLTAILSLQQTAPLSLWETRPLEISATLRLVGRRGSGEYLACFFHRSWLASEGLTAVAITLTELWQRDWVTTFLMLEGIKKIILQFNS